MGIMFVYVVCKEVTNAERYLNFLLPLTGVLNKYFYFKVKYREG